jgi:hypothetical protein
MDDLISYRDEIKTSYSRTSIVPTKGGHGKLTATLDVSADDPENTSGAVTIEVEWLELRKELQTNPAFKDLTAEECANAKKWADDPAAYTGPSFGTGTALSKYAALLAKGVTSWSTGVPVVRRTTRNAGGLTNGTAWVRDTPPVAPTGWEWMKTADRRVRVGGDIQKIEEWTGAKEWDDTLYPAS